MSPSKSSSAVSRQYDGRLLRTVNTSVSGCCTSRVCSSTMGLSTTRVGSPWLMSRQASRASSSAPGRFGPATAPATTASTMRVTPVPTSEDRPCNRRPPAQRDVRSWVAVRCSRAYMSTAPANSAALATGLPGPPSAAANTNRVVAGSTASSVTPTRNAAQSAM